jgi:hypothetical protein
VFFLDFGQVFQTFLFFSWVFKIFSLGSQNKAKLTLIRVEKGTISV